MHKIDTFPITGDAWLLERNGRHFVIWEGVSSGNQNVAVAYQTDDEGFPLPGWHEIVKEKTREAALVTLEAKVGRWPPVLVPNA